jgi:hypothetical protein
MMRDLDLNIDQYSSITINQQVRIVNPVDIRVKAIEKCPLFGKVDISGL